MTDPFLEYIATHGNASMIPLGGNGGDQLIRFAERRLLHNAGRTIAVPGERSDYIAYGGGGLFGIYDDLWVMQEIKPGPESLVFFPRACLWRDHQFLRSFIGEVRRMSRRIVVFARDPISFTQWTKATCWVGCDIEVHLSHDPVVLFDQRMEDDKVAIKAMLHQPCADTVGVFMRDDCESSYWPPFTVSGMNNIVYDPAFMSACPPMDSKNAISCCSHLTYLTICCFPQVVITDRLHVMLARWLFGLDTVLIPTAQHKVKAVWDHSIRHNARNTQFAETLDDAIDILDDYELVVEVTDG